ncbi:MAG: FAD-dependent oxidoreductase [Thermoanaerobaculia bacterium]
MTRSYDFIIVGAGIYGLTAALELHHRGHRVTVLDPGPVPHPLAASTDISKVVRMEYGTDDDYMVLVDEAIDGWQRWNEELGDTLYHQTGVTMLTRAPMAAGGFEHESYTRLLKHGHRPQRLDAGDIARRFPAWRSDVYVDGFFHARGGFAESGRVVEALAKKARGLGIEIYEGQTAEEILRDGATVTGVRTREGESFSGPVIVCAGAWTPYLLPELQPVMKSTGHPVFHLQTDDRELFSPPDFAVFTADVANTGWYGFPLHPRTGVVKVANHGVGMAIHPEHGERVVTAADEEALRRFLADTFPALAVAPVVYTRRCLYNDTLDEHLWIDRHPELSGLTVGAGGSGHAFKMAPVLGGLVADAAEGRGNRWSSKFCWRQLAAETGGQEAARHHG